MTLTTKLMDAAQDAFDVFTTHVIDYDELKSQFESLEEKNKDLEEENNELKKEIKVLKGE